jgi:hypothetical protein
MRKFAQDLAEEAPSPEPEANGARRGLFRRARPVRA